MDYSQGEKAAANTIKPPPVHSPLRSALHGNYAANEHLGVIGHRLSVILDRIRGARPSPVGEASNGSVKSDPALVDGFARAGEETENHISQIRKMVDELDTLI